MRHARSQQCDVSHDSVNVGGVLCGSQHSVGGELNSVRDELGCVHSALGVNRNREDRARIGHCMLSFSFQTDLYKCGTGMGYDKQANCGVK